jgi:hypothetical protein
MKKLLIIIIVSLIATVLAVGPAAASAHAGTIYIKGEVVSVVDGTLIVKFNQNEFVVTVPHVLDIGIIKTGDTVLITGRFAGSGLIEADFLSLAVAGNNDGLPEGSKDNTAYCEANAEPHPLVASLAERHDVSQDEVSQYFCNGFSIEAIMMALMTSEIDEVDVEWSDMLALLADGYSWDQIWEITGIYDNDEDGQSFAGLENESQPSPTDVEPEPTPGPTEDGSAQQSNPPEVGDESEPTPEALVSEPEPTPAAVVSEPEPTPEALVSEPEPTPTEVVSEPEPTPTEVVSEPEPSPTAIPGKPVKNPSKSPVDGDNDDNNDVD